MGLKYTICFFNSALCSDFFFIWFFKTYWEFCLLKANSIYFLSFFLSYNVLREIFFIWLLNSCSALWWLHVGLDLRMKLLFWCFSFVGQLHLYSWYSFALFFLYQWHSQFCPCERMLQYKYLGIILNYRWITAWK